LGLVFDTGSSALPGRTIAKKQPRDTEIFVERWPVDPLTIPEDLEIASVLRARAFESREPGERNFQAAAVDEFDDQLLARQLDVSGERL
jgi:hypothetical protein